MSHIQLSFIYPCRSTMNTVSARLLKGLKSVLEQQRKSFGRFFHIYFHQYSLIKQYDIFICYRSKLY
jgi:hypothetical protein